MTNGVCSSGYEPIYSKSQCEYAAIALGMVDKNAGSGSSSSSPYGCYYRASSSSTSRLWFNPSGTQNNYDTERTAICVSSYSSSAETAETPSSSSSPLVPVVAAMGGVAVASVAFVLIRKQRALHAQNYENVELAVQLESDMAEL